MGAPWRLGGYHTCADRDWAKGGGSMAEEEAPASVGSEKEKNSPHE